jgi:hypothetical protein
VGGIARSLFCKSHSVRCETPARAGYDSRMNAFRTISVVLLLSSGALPARAAASHGPRLPFIEDDYARAIRDARARGVPVFVEAWAPW